jgi:large subunit ribosomal protein L6
MSRIGNAIINMPEGVTLEVNGNDVVVKGKLGELTQTMDPSISVKLEDGVVSVSRANEEKQTKAFHGLYRSLINNMIDGVNNGYEKRMELIGVGYRATNKGQELELTLGFSHNIIFRLPDEIKIETLSERGKAPMIILKSHDKQLLGQVTAKIRAMRKPEPYKGKGIKFQGEYIRRKAGKSAAS